MTIKESLINWLNDYPNFEISDEIELDLLSDRTSYALVKEPDSIIETFIDGSEKRTEYYTFQAKKVVANKVLRKKCDEFLEEFQDWISNKNYNCELPRLENNRYCDNISLSTTPYLYENTERNGIYIFTIEIIYRKEID